MVWADMDPGVDDIAALLALVGTTELVGVSTVAGNHALADTDAHARRVLAALGVPVPVYAGSERPLHWPLETAGTVHGPAGRLLGLDRLPPAGPVPSVHAVDALREAFARAAEPFDLIATGPLTNVARFLAGSPAAARRVRALWVMGGSLARGGNISPLAEFNFYVDPHAADWVLREAPVPVYVVGLDVTERVRWTAAELERWADAFAAVRPALGAALAAMFGYYAGRGDGPERGVAVHDAVAVAAWHRPTWFAWRRGRFRVEPGGRDTRGWLWQERDDGPVAVATDVDVTAVKAWVDAAVLRAAARRGAGEEQ
ncbi:MAG: nucleoside hydrolase [Actinomycetia bacterium]|nr:nucleoside hydrolase [Actinomycetes bacterium]